ncbi:MAG: glycosyltransferase family 4 protein [Candidatus Aenigmarchaeota archaeon]|nr:glycosyltransferase family 4 protein [Candidatus Aenigmarchaeota archaeon]
MRILFLAEYYPPMIQGGAEISLPILAHELSKRHEVHVLTPNYHAGGNEERLDGKIRVHEFSSIRRLFFRGRRVSGAVYAASKPAFSFLRDAAVRIFVREMSRKLEEFCKGREFDVIHANNYESALSLASADVKAAKVAHLRDLRLMKKPLKGMKFIAISDFLREKYAPLMGGDIVTVYNPVKPARPAAKDHDIVLFVGSLTEEKGARLLPAIASCIGKKTLVVVGEGPERPALEPVPNISLEGFAEDTGKYYAKAPILAVPSRWEEGFGRVVAEGQANGCVVVATRKGAIPELIEDGKTGILADSVAEICNAVNSLSPAVIKRISANARKASKKYEPSVIARQMENIYKNMLQ